MIPDWSSFPRFRAATQRAPRRLDERMLLGILPHQLGVRQHLEALECSRDVPVDLGLRLFLGLPKPHLEHDLVRVYRFRQRPRLNPLSGLLAQ